MEPLGNAAALFNGKFHKLGIRRRRSNRKHSLSDTRNGKHGALTGFMFESFFAVGSDYAEGL